MQRRRQGRTPIPPRRRSDQPKRRIGREACRVVEVLVARQAAVDGLPQQIRHPELRIQPLSGVTQVIRDEFLQSEALIQLADQNQPRVGRDARTLERDFQETLNVN